MLKPLSILRKGLSKVSTEGQIPSRSRSTLNDVARMAGVSASTVSLVLAGKAGTRRISEDTHTRVHHAARALGYTPSLLHRSMRRGRTHVLSFYNGFRNREPGDLYMDRLSSAVEHAGGRHGYDVLVHCNFNRSPQETYEFLNGGLSDGLVLFGPPPDDTLLSLLRTSTLPTVLISPSEGQTGLPSVHADEAAGIALIADRLVAQGHRHIAAILAFPGGSKDAVRRYEQLRQKLSGIDLPAIDYDGDPQRTLERALRLSPRPTALFVWHDRLAYQILEACDAMGIRVPEDLSVVGFDGLIWPSTSSHVVESVQVPLEDLADAAVSLLARLIEGESAPLQETIPVQFAPGTTLGPPFAIHSNEG
ncbi:LacI family transcriptional regulator [bacterium]|nr:MAG: LacI family transcriptional regulator [bacterium]